MNRAQFIRLLAVAAVIPRVHGQEAEFVGRAPLTKAFTDGMDVLNKIFWVPEIANWLDRPGKDLRGNYESKINPPWWSCANLVETLVDFMNLTKTTTYDAQIRELYDGNVLRGSRLPIVAKALKQQGKWSDEDDARLERKIQALDPAKIHGSQFRNEYLDDSAWWGVAWLKFHERTREERYLKTAITIHEHMAKNWRPEGGVSWAEDADKRDPNAITNSLFIVLSARLYRVTKKQAFLDWAEKALAWEKEIKLYDGTGIVDRPGHQGDYWTYNQGVYVGGLQALYEVTGKVSHLDEAAAVAATVVAKSGVVTPEGILYEKLSTEGWDVGMFKGICARYFGSLARELRAKKVHEDVAKDLVRVLHSSAAAILKVGPAKDGLFPLEWQEKPRAELYNFNTQASAITALCAALG